MKISFGRLKETLRDRKCKEGKDQRRKEGLENEGFIRNERIEKERIMVERWKRTCRREKGS